MAWEWQVWRCFDDIRETFEEKGWEYKPGGCGDNGVMPLLAESGGYRISFFKQDPGTGECWFELRNQAKGRMVFVHGSHNIPTPEKAAELIEIYGGPTSDPATLRDRPVYSLPMAPMAEVG